MLSLTLKARIAVVHTTTLDVLNVQAVLEEISGAKVSLAPTTQGFSETAWKKAPGTLYYAIGDMAVPPELYYWLGSKQKTLVLVNHPNPPSFSFNAGPLPVPKTLVQSLLEVLVSPKEAEALSPSFSGLTLKDSGDIALLTQARDGYLSSKGVMHTRAMIASKTSGLEMVDTTLGVYVPFEPLREWVELNVPYFLNPPDKRLAPRGVLLNGNRGVGKSQGAKYIANAFGVPMYRIDMASALSKYVGDSESNFSRLLYTIDQEGPCVALFDESEKLFNRHLGGDTGVMSRILSQLLWWMQERSSQVFVVMTTNDVDAIPPELYREGRIDCVFTIPELSPQDARGLAKVVLGSFIKDNKKIKEALAMIEFNEPVSHARVHQKVLEVLKEGSFTI